MAIPANMARVSITGLLPSGESFDTSFWMQQTDLTTQALTTQAAENIAALWTPTLRAQWYATLGTDSSFQKVKVYAYPTGGPNATFLGEAEFATKPGTGNLSDMPLQSCTVVSLRTGQIGRSRRGRMYFPHVNTTLTTNQISPSNATNLANEIADFFADCNALTVPAGTVSVLSQKLSLAASVSQVVVDTRLDVQRRRAESQPPISTATASV